MSARKARKVVELFPDKKRDSWLVSMEERDGTKALVSLDNLARPELARVAKMVFPDFDGRQWIHFTNDAIREAILSGKQPNTVTPKTKAPPAPSADAPTPVPRRQTADEGRGDLVALITKLVDEAVSRREGAPIPEGLARVLSDGSCPIVLIGLVADGDGKVRLAQ